MNIQECYEKLGGSYDEVLGRMRMEKLVEKFMLKFLDDKSYELLITSLDAGDGETAFRAAHTIKGVSQNLSFTRLYESSHELTEALRGGNITPEAGPLREQVTLDYQQTVDAIREYQAQQG